MTGRIINGRYEVETVLFVALINNLPKKSRAPLKNAAGLFVNLLFSYSCGGMTDYPVLLSLQKSMEDLLSVKSCPEQTYCTISEFTSAATRLML